MKNHSPFFDLEKKEFRLTPIILMLMNRHVFRYDIESNKFFIYRKTRYIEFNRKYFSKIIRDLIGTNINDRLILDVVSALETKAISHNLFSSPPAGYLNFCNGVLSLNTMEFLPSSHHYNFLYELKTPYVPGAKCPNFLRFLDQVSNGDADVVDLIQKCFGYCLDTTYDYHHFFIWYGAGANGKSVLSHILMMLLGIENVSNLSILELGDRFRSALLLNKLANVSDETPRAKEVALDLLKLLSSGGMTAVEKKYGDPFFVRNTAKLIFLSNTTFTMEASYGVERRLVVIPFKRTFLPEERDVHLSKKLIEELPGILNWALEGYHKIRSEKGIALRGLPLRETESFAGSSDSVAKFLEEECILSPEARLPSIELYAAYKFFCERDGYRACSNNEFGKRLAHYSKGTVENKRASTGLRVRFYQGITLNTPSPTERPSYL